MRFKVHSDFKPTGDQPQAIQQLVDGINSNEKYQTLLGVTGSGKTFTVANVIEEVQKPTLVLAHNKTLADCSPQEMLEVAQLWQSEYATLSRDKSIAQVMMFENKGKEVGTSNLHPHGQIYASHQVSDFGKRIRQSQHNYAQANGGSFS